MEPLRDTFFKLKNSFFVKSLKHLFLFIISPIYYIVFLFKIGFKISPKKTLVSSLFIVLFLISNVVFAAQMETGGMGVYSANPCTIAQDSNVCTVTVFWYGTTLSGLTSVTIDGNLWANTGGGGGIVSQDWPWVGRWGNTLRLYSDYYAGGSQLDQLTLYSQCTAGTEFDGNGYCRLIPPSGWISTSPGTCTVGLNSNACTTNVSWGVSNTTVSSVSVDGNLWSNVGTGNAQDWPWVGRWGNTFRLYSAWYLGGSYLGAAMASAQCSAGLIWGANDYCVNPPVPSCSSAAPESGSTAATSGTFYSYAYGVSSDVTSVTFPTWGDTNGQNDLVWYGGTNLGGGTWRAAINLGSHPEYGNINTHVYMSNPYYTNTWCSTANFTKLAPVNGVCAATHWTCAAGTGDNTNNVNNWDSASQWVWNCIGQNGGSNALGCTQQKASCVGTPWGTMTSGASNTAYSAYRPVGTACVSESRTCNNGTLSGTYTQTSCESGCATGLYGNLASGDARTAYSTPWADVCSTVSQTRTCSNGTLTGTYGYNYCNVNSYSITFNSAGGSAVSTITQAYGTAVTAPANPTRAGYTFTGWSPALAATMPSGGQALTAQWSAYDDSSCSSISVSGTAYTGQSFSGSITVNNTGGTTWTSAANYNLGSQSPQDNGTWGTGRIGLPSSITSGSTATFSTTFTAPTTAGTYAFAWKTVHDGVAWFGPICTTNIVVSDNVYNFGNNGGTGVSPASRSGSVGSALAGPVTNPTRTDYTFTGWWPAIPATMPAGGGTSNAQWAANNYTYTYNNNGGSGVSPASVSGVVGSAVPAPTTNPTRTGYSFSSWSPVLPTTMPSGGGSSNAQWAVNNYTITFDSAGGSAVTAITQAYGSAVSAPVAPTKTGYTFAGWSPAVPATMGLSQTLTATWTVIPYTLTIPVSGGNGSGSYGGTAAGSVNYGTAVSITATPAASSNFTSWTATGAASACNGSAVSPCAFTMTGAASVTANYTLKTYTLSYTAGANGTLSGTASQVVNYGASGTAVTAVPNTGYSFVNWSDAVATAARTDSSVTANKSVTANFSINSYTLTFNTNGGDGGATAPQSLVYNTPTALTTNGFTRTNYTFTGWNTAANGSGTAYANGASYTIGAGAATLYAQWSLNGYTLSIPASGGNGSGSYGGTGAGIITVNAAVSITATPAVSSNFTSWTATGAAAACNGSATSPCAFTMTGVASVNSNYTLKTFTLSYTAGANGTLSGTASQVVNYGASGTAVTAVPNTGYSFVNWSDAVATAARTDSSVTANKSVTANFSVNSYTVTFNTNGGDGGATAPQSLVYNTPTALTVNGFTRTGYAFTGWNTAANGSGTAYANGASYTIGAGGVTLYAQWTINSYTVTFNGNGSDGGATAPQSLVYNTPTALTLNGFTRTGYVSNGWNTVANGSGTAYANAASYTIGAGAVTLYSQWVPIPYTYTVGASGGNGSGTYGGADYRSGNINYGASVSITATPAVSSNFTSWTGSGSAITCNGSAVSPCAFTMTTHSGVSANYTLKTSTLTYTAGANGTLTGTASQTVNYGASGTAVTAVPNTGYYFVNWSDASTANPRTDTNVTGNISVTANFSVSYLSCNDVLARGASTGNGIYRIDPDGNGGLAAINAYCDMTTDGGGWTLVLLNSSYATPPKPVWSNAVSSNNVTGSFSTNLDGGFDQMLGVGYWNLIGSEMRVETGASSASISHRAYFNSTLDASNFYALNLTNPNITIGGTTPGIYAYHAANKYSLTTSDADHDVYGSNCSASYGSSPWWYGACWDGSFWGGGDSGSYQNKPFWTGSANDYYNWGAIWVRGPTNLVLYSSLQEGTGATTKDWSPNGYTGTISGSATWTSGKVGNALSFAGASIVDEGNAMAGTWPAMTISAWVNPSSAGTWRAIVQTGPTSDHALYLQNNYLQFYPSCNSTTAVPNNQWTHVTATIDGADAIKYYINGVAAGGCASSGLRLVEYLHISGQNVADGEDFQGKIDEVRVYNKALSATEVLNLYKTTPIDLIYTAGANGTLSGTATQSVIYGANGTAVTAVPNGGYVFVNWSDGSVANPRTDTAVVAGVSVTANFAVTPPVLTNATSTSVTDATVTLGATVTSAAALSARGICWGTIAAPTSINGTCTSSGTSVGTYTQPITGLTPGLVYYYRGYAINAGGTAYSSDGTFTTETIPTVSLIPTATAVGTSSAVLGATITSTGGPLLTSRGTCWDYSMAPTTNCLAEGGNTASTFAHIRSGFLKGSTIYYRGYATNIYGTAYTSDGTINSVSGTSLDTGVDPATFNLAPGSTATTSDTFTFKTDTGTDVISAVVVNITNASSTSLIEITNDAGNIIYGATAYPTGATATINLSLNTLTATSTAAQYRIRITPKTRSNLTPATSYPVTTTIASWTSTNASKTGSDTSNIVNVDNLGPSLSASAGTFSVTASNGQAGVNYVLPRDADLNSVVVVYDTTAVTGTPLSGTNYNAGDSITPNVSTLVVGGGGGGGTYAAGAGGGAGGLIYNSAYAITSQAYSVVVGNGGTGGDWGGVVTATNGSNSTFGTITAIGGGRGGAGWGANVGQTGGSGGGGSGFDGVSSTATVAGGAGTFSQGNNGGIGRGISANRGAGGGGGGAGGLGGDSTTSSGGNGGVGLQYSISGTPTYYAGGGGGADYQSSNGGVGGLGGGGNISGGNSSGIPGGNGTANTGGGGGASKSATADSWKGGNGGSGIVIISAPTGVITSATGGTKTTANGNDIWTFTSNGTWTPTLPAYSLKVGCVDTNATPGAVSSCNVTGLTNGVSYHFKIFAKDKSGNYSSVGIVPSGSPITANVGTVLATGVDPVASNVAPGSSATTSDTFTFKTDTGTDVISAVVVNMTNASSTSLLEITNNAGTTVYGSVANPTGVTVPVTLSTNTLTVTSTTTQYRIRITPKARANLTTNVSYPVITTIASWTGTNTNKSGVDTANAVSVDNMGPTFPTAVEVLVVGGGGGGGGGNPIYDGNGGGGAGGLIYNPAVPVDPNVPISIVVGTGGNGGAKASASPGADGLNSSFSTITAIGGGGGGSDGALNGRLGGSGGGASTSGGGGIGGLATAGQGNVGGLANNPGGAGPGGGGGGGGGAGSAGLPGNQNQPGGTGGSGVTYSISGLNQTYAAGGGGSSWTGAGGAGGNNTGGSGASRTLAYPATNAVVNTGSGGGAGTATQSSTSGASGIVIVSAPLGTITSATGGVHTVANNKDIWTFTSSGTWTPTFATTTPTVTSSSGQATLTYKTPADTDLNGVTVLVSTSTVGSPLVSGTNYSVGNSLTSVTAGAVSGTQVYSAVARTGTGAAATVTGVGFPPDLVLTRSGNTARYTTAYDRLRGAQKFIVLTLTNQEAIDTASGGINSFDMDGVGVGADFSNPYTNASGETYINWFFQRYPGVFDEVVWTATGSTQTVTHNLGVAPELIISADRSIGQTRPVGGTILSNTEFLILNSTAAKSSAQNVWNNTTPTATSFTVGNATSWINNAGDSNVAYLFATKAGISKVGSYTGNGTSQTLDAGFTGGAKFILIKRTDSTGDWYVWDSVRGINTSANDPHLSLNSSAAEVTNDDSIDPTNVGFIVKQNGNTNVNATGATYIYLAFSGDTPNITSNSTVGCIDPTTTPGTTSSCTVTGLADGTAYNFKLFAKDNFGNYGAGIAPANGSATPGKATVIATGSDPANTSIAPTDSSGSAIVSIGTLGTASSTVSDTTLVLKNSSAAEAGNLVTLLIAKDNYNIIDGDFNEVSSIVDSSGNSWVKVSEFTNGQGVAGDGATASLWYSVITNTIPINSNITINFANAITAKAVTAWEYSIGSGDIISVATTSIPQAIDTSTPASISLTGLTSSNYLFIRSVAYEDRAQTITSPTVSHTKFPEGVSNGGSQYPSMTAMGEFLTLTGTGDTSAPTVSGVGKDGVSMFVALKSNHGTSTPSNAFTLRTDTGTDVISTINVNLVNPNAVSLLEITNDAGNTVYGSVTNPSATSTSVAITGLTVNTSATQYRIRITPKARTALNASTTYPVTATVSSWTGTNANKSGVDTANIVNVDNLGPTLNLNSGTFSVTSSSGQVLVNYITPSDIDLNSIIVLRNTTSITDIPVSGLNYTVGNQIGTSYVGCIDTNSTPNVNGSCTITGLSNGTTYYFKIFAKDNVGNYGAGVIPPVSTSTPNPGITLTTGTDPTTFNIAPSSATTSDKFILKTDSGNDTVSAVVINMTNASALSLLEIISDSDAGATVYGSVSNPTTSTTSVTLTGLVASVTPTQYRIRITPKARGVLASNTMYPVSTSIASFTSSSVNKSGSDTSNIVYVDKMPPASTYGSGINWTNRISTADNNWTSVAYGNGTFVAVANTGTGNRVMISPDGVRWLPSVSAPDNDWTSVTYGNGLFVAVSTYMHGTIANRVMTSPDGITWTPRTAAADNNWTSVTYGNGLFVAVAASGSINDLVMTSPDGINWTSRTAANFNTYSSVTYGNGLFVAVATYGTGNRVMTSPDGITWTLRQSATDNQWSSVAYGNGLFVAVSFDNTNNSVMTSTDGLRWISRSSIPVNLWSGVTYGNGLFVAVGNNGSGNRVMTSPDGVTWTPRTTETISNNGWNSIVYSNGMFVAVSGSGVSTRVMVSSQNSPTVTPSNAKAVISYTTPGDYDLNSIVVLRSLTPITDAPSDDTTYTAGQAVGVSATVACVDTSVTPGTPDSCIATGLTNGVAYHFKVFAKDNAGNYSSGIMPTGSPATPNGTPSQIKIAAFRFIKDTAPQASETDSAFVPESTAVSSNFYIGDITRLRLSLINAGGATTTMKYQIQYSSGSCTNWTTLSTAMDQTPQDFKVDSSPYVADNEPTAHYNTTAIASIANKSFVPGRIQTFYNTTSDISLAPNQYTELEFAIRATPRATPYTSYCFRLTNAGDSSDFDYTNSLMVPRITPGDRNFRPYAGGGGAGTIVHIEAPVIVATTTVTGGGASGGGNGSTTEATSTPTAPPQATTTPGGGGGGGGDVGFLNIFKLYASKSTPTLNSSEGIVLGASTAKMCTNMDHRMFYGVDDSTTAGEVSELQYYLKGIGYFNERITGYFGNGTREAVKQFQRDNNLIVTGIAGNITRMKINKLGCIKA